MCDGSLAELTSKRKPGNIEHRSRKGADDRYDHPDDHERNRACSMVGESVHHNREGEHVAAHDENEEDNLSEAKNFTTDGTEDHIACK